MLVRLRLEPSTSRTLPIELTRWLSPGELFDFRVGGGPFLNFFVHYLVQIRFQDFFFSKSLSPTLPFPPFRSQMVLHFLLDANGKKHNGMRPLSQPNNSYIYYRELHSSSPFGAFQIKGRVGMGMRKGGRPSHAPQSSRNKARLCANTTEEPPVEERDRGKR